MMTLRGHGALGHGGCHPAAAHRSLMMGTAILAIAGTAQAAGIRATVDRNKATLNDRLQLTLSVEGSQFSNPQLPDLSAFKVQSAGTSRQMQIINGRTSSSVSFNYILVPRRAGTFTIGKARVVIDGQTYESRPFQVRIAATGAQPRRGGDGDLFVTQKVSDTTPYAGEQLIYTLRFYRRVRIAQANAEIPDFEGFLVEELGEQKNYTSTVRGREYSVTEIKRALFPLDTGELVIPAAALTVEVVRGRSSSWFFDPFGSGGQRSQTQIVRSSPLPITVRPLPAEPPGYSGLVGKFAIQSQLSKSALKVGESTTLTLVVSGTGNVRSIPEPKVGGLTAFKVYDDKPASSVEATASGIRGSKTFRRALVPLQEGNLTLPPVTLVYFDPQAGSYKTSRTRATSLSVAAAAGKEELKLTELIGAGAQGIGKVAVRVLADDIRPIYTSLDALGIQRLSPRLAPLWGGGFVIPPLLFFGLAWSRRRMLREASNQNIKRRRTALRRGLKSISALGRTGNSHGGPPGAPTTAAIDASRALRVFIGDALGVEGLALTPKDVVAHLRGEDVDDAVIHEVASLLERCEATQYGTAGLDADELARLPKILRQLMTRIDKQLPARRTS